MHIVDTIHEGLSNTDANYQQILNITNLEKTTATYADLSTNWHIRDSDKVSFYDTNALR
jgi:hypothetical protein